MGVRHHFDEHGEVLDTVSYDSVEKAQADCQEFFEVFGNEAKEGATL